jgi:hypothetical protein
MRRCPAVAFTPLVILALAPLQGCIGSRSQNLEPSIAFTEIPEAGPGGATPIRPIGGRVTGARDGQQIVLYARAGTWWVQPYSTKPFTAIGSDAGFRTTTHLGTDYAALLVDRDFKPPKRTDALPAKGGLVDAVTVVEGRRTPGSDPYANPPKPLEFSGYVWDRLDKPVESGGVPHPNNPDNAWTDSKGRLHLRISRNQKGEWECAEILMNRSLGYGPYSFVVRDIPKLDPAVVLGMFTWDPSEAGQNHREIDIELSQWGDPASRNAQYVIQPYYVAANVSRFDSPAHTTLTHSFVWEAGRVSFQTIDSRKRKVGEHVFTSGVPSPGDERVHLNLYTYGKSRQPLQRETEVVIEKFTYLP